MITSNENLTESLGFLKERKIAEIKATILNIILNNSIKDPNKQWTIVLKEKNLDNTLDENKEFPEIYFLIKDSKIIRCSLEKLFKDSFVNRQDPMYLYLMINKAIENSNGDFNIEVM